MNITPSDIITSANKYGSNSSVNTYGSNSDDAAKKVAEKNRTHDVTWIGITVDGKAQFIQPTMYNKKSKFVMDDETKEFLESEGVIPFTSSD